MKKKLIILILFFAVIVGLCIFLAANSSLNNKSCIRRGDTPIKEDKPYAPEEFEKLEKSCCFGLLLYTSPNDHTIGNSSYCQPFYYPAVDKAIELSSIFLSFYFWFYSVTSLIVIYLAYWLIKNNKK